MMAKTERKEQATDHHEGLNLKGTLYSVGIVGLVIILSWIGVWSLFLSR